MAFQNADETVIAGSGQVYVAATGTALPTTAGATPNAAFNGLGYHTEEGVGLNKPLNIQEFRAWQVKNPIRIERGDEDFILSFALLQWNETSVPLAFGGGAISSDGGSGYKYTPPQDSDALPKWALICDVDDGSDRMRFVIPEGQIADGVDTQFNRQSMSSLPISFRAVEPEAGGDAWYALFNETRFAAGS
jgi:hypothetical protein